MIVDREEYLIDQWNLSGLLDQIKSDDSQPDRRFAFILGAGASITSGIKSASELIDQWLLEIYKRECSDEKSIDEWSSAENLGIENFKYNDRINFYSEIFDRRFKDTEEGYLSLQSMMEGSKPSVGYLLLAQFISKSRHNVIVTTNFDNLMSQALVEYSGSLPVIVGHEAIAKYARPSLKKPLIAKIHRDLFLEPINDKVGTSILKEDWSEVLSYIFSQFTPIVIGYGGNDGSLMDFIESLPKGHIPGRIYWTYYSRDGSKKEVDTKIQRVLYKHNGVLVPITGFDEFMTLLRYNFAEKYNLNDLIEDIQKKYTKQTQNYKYQIDKLLSHITESGIPFENGSIERYEVLKAAQALAEQVDSPLKWKVKAEGEKNFNAKRQTYLIGLNKFPDSIELLMSYARILTENKKFPEANEIFDRALSISPASSAVLGNYANFLNFSGDLDRAEEYYQRAIETGENLAQNFGNFAMFFYIQRHNMGKAEEYFQKSLQENPNFFEGLLCYADFLKDCRRDLDAAERYYSEALEVNPVSEIALEKYAYFLLKDRKNLPRAERIFNRLLGVNPDSLNGLNDYGKLLFELGRINDSSIYFAQALEKYPDDSQIRRNVAVLCQVIQDLRDQGKEIP